MTENSGGHRGQAFGLNWRSDFPLPVFAPLNSDARWDITVERAGSSPAAIGAVSRNRRISVAEDRVRLDPGDGDVIEILGADRILVIQSEPVPHLPRHFFGSALAVLLALRGAVPLHASAVELDGQATLIFARRGAGKSSMAAALIGLGARLISDDLSALVLDQAGHPGLLPGKTGLRLYPGTRTLLCGREGDLAPEPDEGGKLRFRPPHIGGGAPVPIRRIVHLDAADTAIPRPFSAPLMNEHIFRPRTVAELPGKQARYAALKATTERIGIDRVVGLTDLDLVGFASRANALC
jgi:hypothetical protein